MYIREGTTITDNTICHFNFVGYTFCQYFDTKTSRNKKYKEGDDKYLPKGKPLEKYRTAIRQRSSRARNELRQNTESTKSTAA